MGVDKLGVEEMRVDEMGSRRSGMTHFFCDRAFLEGLKF